MNTLHVGPLYGSLNEPTHLVAVLRARFLDIRPAIPWPKGLSGSSITPPSELKQPFPRLDPLPLGQLVRPSHAQKAELMPPPPPDSRLAPFLTKLYELVTSAETDGAVRWDSDGTAFRIIDPTRLAREVLPRYFKHNKLGSFTQQLHTYGFYRMQNESLIDPTMVRVVIVAAAIALVALVAPRRPPSPLVAPRCPSLPLVARVAPVAPVARVARVALVALVTAAAMPLTVLLL